MKKSSFWAVGFLGLAATAAWAAGTLIESATESFGTMTTVTTNGSVAVTPSLRRFGANGFLHRINGTSASKRAEIDDASWHKYPAKGMNTWYGFSLYIPDNAQWSSPALRQYVSQWRFSNLKVSGYAKANCEMSGQGGSGHHLLVSEGRWRFTFVRQNPNLATCGGLTAVPLDLGAVERGVWTDFVIQAKLRHTSDGNLRIWKQVNGGGYSEVSAYRGANWFDRYQADSQLAGRDVMAPNFTVGLYWSNDALQRDLYSDQIRVFQVPSAEDVVATSFDQVRADAASAAATGTTSLQSAAPSGGSS